MENNRNVQRGNGKRSPLRKFKFQKENILPTLELKHRENANFKDNYKKKLGPTVGKAQNNIFPMTHQ